MGNRSLKCKKKTVKGYKHVSYFFFFFPFSRTPLQKSGQLPLLPKSLSLSLSHNEITLVISSSITMWASSVCRKFIFAVNIILTPKANQVQSNQFIGHMKQLMHQ